MNLCKKCQCEYIGNACRPCANIVAAEYRKNNKEKMRIANEKWKTNNPEKTKATARRVIAKRKSLFPALEAEKARIAQKKWAALNPEKVKEIKRKTTLKNKVSIDVKARARTKKWKGDNPDQVRIQSHNQRSALRSAGGNLSKDISSKLMLVQRGKCACCGASLADGYHIDHIVPIKLGGNNTDSNVQLLTKKCNLQKGIKHPVDFMRSRGFLL